MIAAVGSLAAIPEIVGALMVACSIKPGFEAGIATPFFSWGRNAVPVRFNRGLFRVGVVLMALGAIVGALR